MNEPHRPREGIGQLSTDTAREVASQRNPIFELEGWRKDYAHAEQVDEHDHCERQTDCCRLPRNSGHGTAAGDIDPGCEP